MKTSFSRSFSTIASILLLSLVLLGTSFQMLINDYMTDNTISGLMQDGQILADLAAAYSIDGKKVDTPPKEMELLFYLASSPNRVYTRNQLLDEVWGFDYFGDSRTVDVHVKRLREKLEGVSETWCLKTVWGVGYKFEVLNA